MYIIILTYTHGLEKIEMHLMEHRAFLDKQYALNKFICSGAQNPRTGGVILCKADSIEEVECKLGGSQIVLKTCFLKKI